MKTKSMSVHDNQLFIGPYKVSDLAKAYQTPLYIYDEVHMREKLSLFKKHFKSSHFETLVVYASKAFLSMAICELIDEYDMGIDSVSMGDLMLLSQANFPKEKIIMHGNNKSSSELTYAIHSAVGYVVVDHIEELLLLDELTRKDKKSVKILLRINPGIEAHTHAYIKTSLLSSKFGESIYDLTRLGKMIEIAQSNPYLLLEGFHAHIGSNISNPKSFVQEIEVMSDFLVLIKERFGYQTNVLNLGGGFGIKYLDSDSDIDIEEMMKQMISSLNDFVIKKNFPLKMVMIEPGRSIVGDAGFTVYQVGAVKETFSGKKYVFVDGGMTDNIRPALYQAKYTVEVADSIYQNGKTSYDVVGKCCESGDIVATDVVFSHVASGDYLVVYATGAYGYSMASNYNGALKNAVIFVRDKEVKLAVKRETYDDLVKTQVKRTQKVIDAHCDVLYDLYTKKLAGVNNRFEDYHVKQLLNSNISGAVWTMYSPDDFDLLEACKSALNQIDLSKLPGFEVILGLEGLRNLKEVEDIDTLYAMGFRHAMLTWNEENKYATGAKAEACKGLKPEGIRLLKRMEELGMIIDLAHLNEKSFYEALDVVSKNIIYSHGNVKALCDHVRNVTDEQMLALKKADGLLGLTLANNFVAKEQENQTLDQFMAHVKHAVSVMGVDHVCFGFDFMDYLSDFPNSNLSEVDNATKVDLIVEALEKNGFSKEEIRKICYDNFYNRFAHLVALKG